MISLSYAVTNSCQETNTCLLKETPTIVRIQIQVSDDTMIKKQ